MPLSPADSHIDKFLTNLLVGYRPQGMIWDQVAPTVPADVHRGVPYGLVETPPTLRRLTVRECARLQAFPDSHTLCGPKTAQYRQVGNACPPTLAQVVAEAVRKVFEAGEAGR